MKRYKTELIKNFLKEHNSNGKPEDLLKKLIHEDLASFDDLKNLDSVEKRLQVLSSYRGIKQPQYIELPNEQIAATKNGEILINSNQPKSRQLFGWAHEIIHSYFPGSTKVTYECLGSDFSFDGENVEEESLCNFGASELIFYGTPDPQFSITSMEKIARQTGASLEATACFMYKYAPKNGGTIVWKRNHKKSQNPDQICMFGIEEKHPFRIVYAWIKGDLFLPKNKSVNQGDAIEECEENGYSSGKIGIDLNDGRVELITDNVLLSSGVVISLFTQ